jgi:hypothetical protein
VVQPRGVGSRERGGFFVLSIRQLVGLAEVDEAVLTLSKLPLSFDISRSLSLDSWITF